jgi:hypothetical protein
MRSTHQQEQRMVLPWQVRQIKPIADEAAHIVLVSTFVHFMANRLGQAMECTRVCLEKSV